MLELLISTGWGEVGGAEAENVVAWTVTGYWGDVCWFTLIGGAYDWLVITTGARKYKLNLYQVLSKKIIEFNYCALTGI